MSTLCDFVQGKRVAVVGPAPYLEGKGEGTLIDSYDIILRPNNFSIPNNLKCDYGSRTDIMNHNFGTPWMPGLKDLISKNLEDFKSLKFCMCTAIKSEHSETDILNWPDDYVSNVVRNFNEVNEYDVPFYWVGVKKYHDYYRMIGCEPYTGVLSVVSLLECQVKEVYVTGFDFYQGSVVYYDGCLSPLNASKYKSNAGGSHGGDSKMKQILFLRSLVDQDDRLNVDEKLKSIIS